MAEIAKRQDVSAAAVRKRLSRAVVQLRTRLDETHDREWRTGIVLLTPGRVSALTKEVVLMSTKQVAVAVLAVASSRCERSWRHVTSVPDMTVTLRDYRRT